MNGWRAWLALSAALTFPCAAGAQVVRGTVVNAVDATPLPGVVVTLVGPGDKVVDRALTDERGGFRLDGTAPGTYRIRTLRIGFRPVTTPPFVLRSLEQTTRRIEVAGLPVSLEAVQVAARSVCRDFADDTIGPAAIWQQAKTALTAAELTSRARTLEATIVTYTRVLEPYSERVRQQASSVRSGLSSRVWTAHPLESLRERGYVRDDPDGGTTYFAPDLAVLMSDAFVEDHCFHVVSSRDPALIGIAFEPTRERRRIPEISGTVWLDRRSSELRSMEFGYVNVSKAQARAGGDMTFVRLGTGGWVISRWNIRMPAIERRVRNTIGGLPGAATTVDERLIETRVSGGELALVTRLGDTLWMRAPMTLRGFVTDSATRAAVSGARVHVRGTGLSAVSGSDGAFAIGPVLPGAYALDVATPEMEALGLLHSQAVRFADTLFTHRIRLPSTAATLLSTCGALTGARTGIITGRVRLVGDSTAPRNITVTAEWRDSGVHAVADGVMIDGPRLQPGSRADATGTFRICGVPVDTDLVIRATRDSVSAQAAARIPPGARVARVELLLDRGRRPR